MGTTLPGHSMRSDPWLTLSSLGTGTYLGQEDDDTDEQVASAIIISVQRRAPVQEHAQLGCAALCICSYTVVWTVTRDM